MTNNFGFFQRNNFIDSINSFFSFSIVNALVTR